MTEKKLSVSYDPDKVVKVQLTEEQKQALAEAFGADTADRVQELTLDHIAGFISARVVVN
jgi:hypothetical protein